jgi:hypothetical protein
VKYLREKKGFNQKILGIKIRTFSNKAAQLQALKVRAPKPKTVECGARVYP